MTPNLKPDLENKTQPIILSIEDQVAIVTLNRPDKCNAINMEMFYLLNQIQKKLRANRQIRAVILKANGNDFSSGLDVKSIMAHKKSVISLLWKWWPFSANLAQKVVDNWQHIPVPVICLIQSRCWGAGLQIALGCDFRIAHPESVFSIMESHWGLIPDMAGNLAMHANMKLDKAMLYAMTAEQTNSYTALADGLITAIADNPGSYATELINKIKSRSPDPVAGIKKLYYQLWNSHRPKALAKETAYQCRIIMGKNQKRAIKANQAKIAPKFQDRLPW